jgi:large subunit ribosomal protein L21
MFAIVKITGKQYIVSEGQEIDVDKLTANEGDTITLTDVLLTESDSHVEVGTPVVKKATVTAKVLKQLKGEKIDVRRYKSKVRYRKSTGFRPHLTKLQIVSIS